MTAPAIQGKIGIDCKLYVCAAGIGATPTWVEVTSAKNVTVNLGKGEADASNRSTKIKLSLGTLQEWGLEFNLPWNASGPGVSALKDAYLNNTAIGVAAMDGPIATVGSEGPWFDAVILDFTRDENLEEEVMLKVVAKPCPTANPPVWKTIAT